jgi:hypothetical protein
MILCNQLILLKIGYFVDIGKNRMIIKMQQGVALSPEFREKFHRSGGLHDFFQKK